MSSAQERRDAPLVLLAGSQVLGERWCGDHMDALGWPPRKVRLVSEPRHLLGLGACQIVVGPVLPGGGFAPDLLDRARVLVAAGSRWAVVREDAQIVESPRD